ncbi:MAG: ATP phosphoribosyltransferase regulatory subunit [Methylophilaceae bacterium]|nr:ATP phosphoribosyltransferase regulatory subunit [Methylophilaceae bacterium]
MRHWLLPEYIEDVLPADAWRIELLRRRLLDLFHRHGYRFVIPPLLEYVESLTTGVGRDLDLLTFKVVDQISGRLMGIRSDITPQTARIDAHLLNQQGVTRLCYAGSVLRTQPSGMAQTRQPLQVGAELFGHAGIESDLEIQRLLVQALKLVGVEKPHLDFSHVAIFRALVTHAGIDPVLESDLFAALQVKDTSALAEMTAGIDKTTREALQVLPSLYGGAETLQEAQRRLPQYAEIKQALQDLRRVAHALSDMEVTVSFDLSELRGYRYHSGLVFAAYAEGWSGALALGGRYDEVGLAFGRPRPATGFSMDMRALIGMLPPIEEKRGILAPYREDAALSRKIEELRAAGEIVVVELPGHEAHRAELGCDRMLVRRGEDWEILPITQG